MKTWKNHIKEPYFTLIKRGIKTVEGRVQEGKYAQISVGDQIIVQSQDEVNSFNVLVVRINRYETFRDMLVAEGINRLFPNLDDIEDGILEYRRFYSEKEEKEYGVVAIEIKLI